MGSLRRFVTLFESLQETPRGEPQPAVDLRADEDPGADHAQTQAPINEISESPPSRL